MPSEFQGEKRGRETKPSSSASGEFPSAMAAAGEASSTVLRFFCFIGAGVICTKAINTYLDYERKQEASAAAAAAEEVAAAAAAVAADPSPATAAATVKS